MLSFSNIQGSGLLATSVVSVPINCACFINSENIIIWAFSLLWVVTLVSVSKFLLHRWHLNSLTIEFASW